MNDSYLNNGYFYLTCNCCDRVISINEMSMDQYNKNGGNCFNCYNLEAE